MNFPFPQKQRRWNKFFSNLTPEPTNEGARVMSKTALLLVLRLCSHLATGDSTLLLKDWPHQSTGETCNCPLSARCSNCQQVESEEEERLQSGGFG
ncbi:hypothetical protein TNCT_396721 [Trichonephila clavata]|uniref:Uncharacterized protein n=1 Tax=Trichonephila clavata TaxID=2740835 RepID=A0A8X6KUV7_TRICU|nr:hypothetical protein TNCT_396721 [Trichonephila clavata]